MLSLVLQVSSFSHADYVTFQYEKNTVIVHHFFFLVVIRVLKRKHFKSSGWSTDNTTSLPVLPVNMVSSLLYTLACCHL